MLREKTVGNALFSFRAVYGSLRINREWIHGLFLKTK